MSVLCPSGCSLCKLTCFIKGNNIVWLRDGNVNSFQDTKIYQFPGNSKSVRSLRHNNVWPKGYKNKLVESY